MLSGEATKASVYLDFNGLNDLRADARSNSPEALKTVAKQFESLFLQMMLKSMREASLGEGLFESNQTGMYRDLYDKQLAVNLADTQSLGLSDLIIEQLGGNTAEHPVAGDNKAYPVPERQRTAAFSVEDVLARVRVEEGNVAAKAGKAAVDPDEPFASPADFVRRLWPQAEAAAERLGTSPRALIAQAALETGWGKAVIRNPDGSSSFNLFNIKADHRWDGDRVPKMTLEYRDGVADKERAWFRAYGSFEDSFNDYVDFLQSGSRYDTALAKADDPGAFVEELQRAGYATDPEYAPKIKRIMDSDAMAEGLAALKISTARTLS